MIHPLEQGSDDTDIGQLLEKQFGTPDRPPLANQVEMDGLLRQFLADAANSYDAMLAGEIDNVTASENSLTLADNLTDILLGQRDAGYTLIPWFSPDQLGRYVMTATKFSGTPREAVHSAVLGLFGKLYTKIKKAQAEFRSMKDFMPDIDLAVVQYISLFLSLPIPAQLPPQEPKIPFIHCPECDNRVGCAKDQNCYKAELAKPDPPYTPESPAYEKAYEAWNNVITALEKYKKGSPHA